jgi:hypothetical protein
MNSCFASIFLQISGNRFRHPKSEVYVGYVTITVALRSHFVSFTERSSQFTINYAVQLVHAVPENTFAAKDAQVVSVRVSVRQQTPVYQPTLPHGQ